MKITRFFNYFHAYLFKKERREERGERNYASNNYYY